MRQQLFSIRTWIVHAGCWLLLLQMPAAQADGVKLPEISDASASTFSPALDKRIGRAFMRRLQKEAPLIQDPEIGSYLRTLGLRLAAQSNEPSRSFDFFFINNPQINAFAGPGGNIGMHTGLLLTTETESEFASVLAHEISHVTQHHLPRAFDRAQRMSLPTMAALLGAIIIGSQGGGDAGLAAVTAVQASSVQMQIDFTRQNEKEADRSGIEIVAASGFDPQAMPGFFQRMHNATRFSQGRDIPTYLRSHPVTLDRISDSSNRAALYKNGNYLSSTHYYLIKERLRTLIANDMGELINYYQILLQSEQIQYEPALRYGLANALMQKADFSAAKKEIDNLRRENPDELLYVITEVKLDFRTNNHEKAEKLLAEKLDLHPGNMTLMLLRGEALLHMNRAAEARQLLTTLIRKPGAPADAYQLLSRAADATGDPAEAAIQEAEYHLTQGDLDISIVQLMAAGKIPGISFVQLSRIEDRLRELQEEQKTEEEFFR